MIDLLDLPDDIILLICSKCTSKNLTNLRKVNRRFYQLITENILDIVRTNRYLPLYIIDYSRQFMKSLNLLDVLDNDPYRRNLVSFLRILSLRNVKRLELEGIPMRSFESLNPTEETNPEVMVEIDFDDVGIPNFLTDDLNCQCRIIAHHIRLEKSATSIVKTFVYNRSSSLIGIESGFKNVKIGKDSSIRDLPGTHTETTILLQTQTYRGMRSVNIFSSFKGWIVLRNIDVYFELPKEQEVRNAMLQLPP